MVQTPVLIIGTGIAGLLTALKLSQQGVPSLLITKRHLRENSSWMAQGGIAAVLPENPTDSIDLHVQDTLQAGVGLCEQAIAESIIAEGFAAIDDLIALGVPFDRQNGQLAFAKEGAHSANRILHAGGDATGRSIQDTLLEQAKTCPLITIWEEAMAQKLCLDETGRCIGAHVIRYDQPQAHAIAVNARLTVLATGGLGQLYSHTTNPLIATGDGIALAYEAGATIQDVEFVQFHPTAFWQDGEARFLISEALRGEGAILRNANGEPFAQLAHPLGELAPRDIVTRAIAAQIVADQTDHVWLDISHLPADLIEQRFPTILKLCQQFGVDIRTQRIPVAPAAHYAMGGVHVNTMGQTSIPSLFAVGEVVSSGLHGANRLASNSLLECVVLARRVARHAAQLMQIPPEITAELSQPDPVKNQSDALPDLQVAIQALKQTMWHSAGILRQEQSLLAGLQTVEALQTQARKARWDEILPEGLEFQKMLITSRLILQAALAREESRGAHYRADYPQLAADAVHSQQQQPTPVFATT